MDLVADDAEAARLARALAAAPVVGFDCEFLAQDRLIPRLCLLQVAYEEDGESTIALVDALAVDVRPLAEALAAHPRPVAHAPRQDLQLLAARFDLAMPQVFDLQIAAAFVGLGDQLGYARLVAAVLGVEHAKDAQWTDWAARPLSPAQVSYAIGDVAHLVPLYHELARRLGPRLSWVDAECQRLSEVARAAAAVREEDAWRDVGGARGLPPRAASVAAALAAWRLATARRLDRPLPHVLPDRALVELARRPPRELAALLRRAPTVVLRERVEEVWALLQSALPPVAAPARRGPPSPRAEALVVGLLQLVDHVAEREGIATRFLATRAEFEALARAYDERGDDGISEHAALRGWRREVFGEACAAYLRGELSIVLEAVAPVTAEGGAACPPAARPKVARLEPVPATTSRPSRR